MTPVLDPLAPVKPYDLPDLDQIDLLKRAIGDDFPEQFYIVSVGSKYGVWVEQGEHFLACFNEEKSARTFAAIYQPDATGFPLVDFDTAREIAKSRPAPLIGLLLLDAMPAMVRHYVL